MSRAAVFAAALAAAFGLAFAGGRVLDVGERSVAAAGEHGEAATEDDAEHGTAAPAGLSVAEDGYRLVPARTALAAGRAGEYEFRIVGPDGRTVRDFEVEHERRLHLIVVRRELNWFLHVHPEQRADGSWRARVRLPVDGAYRVFADFTVAGERRTLGHDLFGVDGGPRSVPEQRSPYEVSLRREADRLELRVSRGGKPVRVQPYLGARGHLVVLRAGDLAYVHAHADGERLAFDVPFPAPGTYRLFLQYKVAGSVQLATLTVRV